MSERKWETIKEYQDILFEFYNGIAKITINRPRWRNAFTPRTVAEMAALFTLDRIHHNQSENGIERGLANGFDVISDRYYYSSLAYQGSLTDYEWVRRMNCDCPEIRRPDLCIFLDMPPRWPSSASVAVEPRPRFMRRRTP